MTCSQYSYRSARPRIGPEPELVRVEVEERAAIVPGFEVHAVTRAGVRRAKRIWKKAEWWKVAP